MKKILLISTSVLLVAVIVAGGVYVYVHRIDSVAEAENFFIESRRAVFIQQDE